MRKFARQLNSRRRVSSSTLVFVSTATVAAASTVYLNSSDAFSTETFAWFPMPFDCVIKKLYTTAQTSPSAGQSFAYTLRVNGADTSLTATISDANTSSNDSNNAVNVVIGDEISMKLITSATATATRHHVVVEVERTL